MLQIEIKIPEKVSTNKFYAGMHWTKRNELKNIYHWELKSAINKYKPKIDKFPIDLCFDFYFKSRMLDADNCSVMAKMITDALRKENIIPDDTYKYIYSVKYSVSRGKEDKIIISC